jgi:hypothetical protein
LIDEFLLENWVRWNRSRRHYGRCGSLEGGWSSRQYWDAPPISYAGRIDQMAAQMVEDAWTTLPSLEKQLLKWHYIFARAPGAICRSLRQKGMPLAPKDYSKVLFNARELLAKAIAQVQKKSYKPDIAVVCVPLPMLEGEVSPREREPPRAAFLRSSA